MNEQIGLPGSQNLLKQQLAESGLEMSIWGAVAGGISAVFGGIAGGQQDAAANKQRDIAHKQAKADWKYQNKQAERDIDFKRELNEVQRWNNFNNAMYQDQSALQNWQMQIDTQYFDYANKLEAKAWSDKTLGQQLGLNQKATQLAKDQQQSWMHDQGIQRDFSLREQDLYMARANDSMDAAYQDILLTRQNEAVKLEGQMSMVQTKRNIERGDVAFAAQESIVDGLIAAGAAQNMQAGRSTDKAIQSAEAKAGRADAKFHQEATNIFKLAGLSMIGLQQDLVMNNVNADIKREQVGRDYVNKSKESYFRREQALESYASAERQNIFKQQEIDQQSKQADINAWAEHYMFEPKLGPQPNPPFATPLPYILDPKDHVWSPKPEKGATSTGGAMAGFMGGLPGIVSGFRADAAAAQGP